MPFLQLKPLNLHYEHQTKGNIPIILLHGNFGSWHYWQPYLQSLPDGYCGYAPDFRGCGDSEVTEDGYDIPTLSNDILLFADELQIDKFHLVGHSLGGAVAQQIAGTTPERILTLTLVAPAPAEGLASLKKTSSSSSFFSPQNILKFLDQIGIKRKLISSIFKKTMPGLKSNEAYLNQAVDDALKMDIKAFNGFLETLKNWRGTQLLKSFDFPVLIMHGELDSVIPLEPLKSMQSQIKNCRFHAFRHIGHSPQLEHPKAFNKLLSAFIRGHNIEDLTDRILSAPRGIIEQLKLKLKRLLNS
ncbi:MAG: alpha/beta hydrolase [Cycloclasticus sp. symbiont of Bathymodiolus heckerae]|nr:MAG: alpha/beta hydrolase [Cycloclasticus sp. symbiont of Bathymodiolus heckerae]